MGESGEVAHMAEVDVHAGVDRATEADEEAVLRELYGDTVQGIYAGEGT